VIRRGGGVAAGVHLRVSGQVQVLVDDQAPVDRLEAERFDQRVRAYPHTPDE
jgi:hypothetical protein